MREESIMAKQPPAIQLSQTAPTHIVLFRQVSEKNVGTMRAALNIETRRSSENVKGMQGITALGRDHTQSAKVFHDLGVGAATMTDAQAEKMQQRDDVEAVFPNEIRKIPRPVSNLAAAQGNISAASERYDYLRGLRDGIDAALQSLSGEQVSLARLQKPSAAAVARFSDTSALTWGLQAIGLSNASAYTGKGIKVAVLDTGFDTNHPDFRNRVAEGRNGKSFVPNETIDQLDSHSHGMHCAGTIAGPAAGGGLRRYGVAPDADLLIGKVLDSTGSGFDDWILSGIQWASDMGARIISMSLGSERAANEPFSPVYERVAERLLQAKPGAIFIAAAGNESDRPGRIAPVGNPAACPSILSVAAVDRDIRVAWFSCGQVDGIGEIDLAAPGVDVYSSIAGGYGMLSGTSMATPHVSGIAAAMLSANPEMSASELWDTLKTSCKPLGQPSDFGAGLAQITG